MNRTDALRKEMESRPAGRFFPSFFRWIGYENPTHLSPCGRRADAIATLFSEPVPYIYRNDRIVGSLRPLFVEISEEEVASVNATLAPFPERNFSTNRDHYAPDYRELIREGIGGRLARIAHSEKEHANDRDALDFLESMRVTLQSLQAMLRKYAAQARASLGKEGYCDATLLEIAQNCETVAQEPPRTFAQGLQLVWMVHLCFLYEERYAMALGRMDQFLYPLYRADREAGRLTKEDATELLENVFLKICEKRFYLRRDDVVNICIGGVDENGNDATNELSECILQAVHHVNLPGPNLSARITPDTPDAFLDACLKVIGTGLGYPALMNDTVNMAALRRYGYREEDVRDYCMVGCIENFLAGKQPPWSDGRFDPPRYLEYLLLGGVSYDGSHAPIPTPPLAELTDMDRFMHALEELLSAGVKEYVERFLRRNTVRNPADMTSPFLSAFAQDCIGRAKDINMGGTIYPSVHGAALMGVGTMSDSLAAIEQLVYVQKECTPEEFAAAMRADFQGHEALLQKLRKTPKYGNNDPFVDKYAVWFTDFLSDCFDSYRTPDGGGIYTAMAANTNNISAGREIGATPDGRRAGQPLSDAASPTYGKDVRGATATLLSVSKPNYSRCACGTVINQKYDPSLFSDAHRGKLLALIRAYLANGGQEIQINATDTDTLRDALENPQNHPSLVVRVSGFSALYVTLERAVQEDILQRTQQAIK